MADPFDDRVIWDDSYSGKFPPPKAYEQEFELQWKLALDGRQDYYNATGVNLEEDQIDDRIYEWTGIHPKGDPGKAAKSPLRLDPPIPVDLIRGKKCIDIGCGMGRWTRVMQKLGAASVLSIDLSESALRSVARFNPNVLKADIMTIPEGHPELVGQFDFANFWGVGMLTHDPLQAFMSAASTVRPGGSLFMMLYNLKGMGGLPEGVRKRRHFHSLKTVEEKLAYVDQLHERQWEPAAGLGNNVRNVARNIIGRPKDPKIGVLDMLEPYYTWLISYEVIEGWMREAGFIRFEILNKAVAEWGTFEILATKG
jgi:SAM-dependent methyltransferase